MNTTISSVKLNKKRLVVMCRLNAVKCVTTSAFEKKIPEPTSLPILGTMLSLLTAGSSKKLHKYTDWRHKQLGPIYREKIGPAKCVFISCPEAMRVVFAHEGRYPVHILPEAWVTYNNKHGNSRGLFFMDGEEWLKYRRVMNKVMLKGDAELLEEACKPIAQNLAQDFSEQSDRNSYVSNLEQQLFTWSLEMLVSILIGPSTYKLWKPFLGEKIRQLGEANQNVFLTTSKLSLISSKFASKYNIPSWRRFEKSVSASLQGSSSLVMEILDKFVHPTGLLQQMREENLTNSEILRIITDLVLAAGDTTSYSMEWTLYCLAKHPNIQERIRLEPSAPLIKNVIKESLRLYPIAPFLTRILPTPVNVLGYTIPENNLIVMSIYTSGRSEDYFDNPDEFLPDRWNRTSNEGSNQKIMQTASLPFAMGARSCIGRRIAEIQMKTTIVHILQNYQITLNNKRDIDFVLKMVGVPSEPIELSFIPLKQ